MPPTCAIYSLHQLAFDTRPCRSPGTNLRATKLFSSFGHRKCSKSFGTMHFVVMRIFSGSTVTCLICGRYLVVHLLMAKGRRHVPSQPLAGW